jgi:hypothetical protein
MRARYGIIGVVLVLAASALAPGAPAPVATKLDPVEMRNRIEHAICLVTVENSWGVPVAVATGFLLGEGRFAVTDLGAVARPGVAQVTLTLADGSVTTATQFGMADAALGLVALQVQRRQGRGPGLPLAPRLPPLDGIGAVAAAGWRWGTEVDVVTGRVWRGPTIGEVAARSRIETPVGVDAFLRMDGGRIDGASGAPVVDAEGTVLAVMLDVAAPDISVALAMPASSLRRSLIESEPALKPLSQLPEPLWPVHVLRLPGQPPKPAPFLKMRGVIKASAVCTRCKGRGRLYLEDARGPAARVRKDEVICPTCRGEGIALESGLFDMMTSWSEQGTRAVWAPGPPDRMLGTARGAGAEMVKWLGIAGRYFREAISQASLSQLVAVRSGAPRGVVLFAQVRGRESGSDGEYVILDPQDGNAPVAVLSDDLMGRDGKGPVGAGREPAEKSWIVLVGTALARFNGSRMAGVYVLPFEWAPAPPPMPLEPLKKK